MQHLVKLQTCFNRTSNVTREDTKTDQSRSNHLDIQGLPRWWPKRKSKSVHYHHLKEEKRWDVVALCVQRGTKRNQVIQSLSRNNRKAWFVIQENKFVRTVFGLRRGYKSNTALLIFVGQAPASREAQEQEKEPPFHQERITTPLKASI